MAKFFANGEYIRALRRLSIGSCSGPGVDGYFRAMDTGFVPLFTNFWSRFPRDSAV
jgi:hypothetical protein